MPPHNITLESPTGRFRMAPPHPADDEAAASVRCHPVTRRYLQFFPTVITAEDVRMRREARAEDPRIIDFYLYAKKSDGTFQFAGFLGIFNIDEANESCEAGLVVDPARQQQGLATEGMYMLFKWAFEDRNLHRITLETSVENAPMRGWLERVAGIRLEANRMEGWKIRPGEYCDVVGYALLDWEWRDRIKPTLEKRIDMILIGRK